MSTALGLPEPMTRRVVAAAGMAPSLFNTQPWKFRLRPDRIEVHADLGRRLIATDPEDRELRISVTRLSVPAPDGRHAAVP